MSNVTSLSLRKHIYIRPKLPAGLRMMPAPVQKRSAVHSMTLALVWLAIASSAIVFTEPAPADVLMLAAIVVLPVVGLATFRPLPLVLGAGLVIICALGLVAALAAGDAGKAATHMGISLYLSLSAIVIAAFVVREPEAHARLILQAHLAGALLASLAALTGYFDLVPGSAELFTKFDRASGTFKDPNVFGAFLVPAIVFALHAWLQRPLARGLPLAAALVVLSVALLVSFSRGAWMGTVLAIALYLVLSFVCTRRASDRLRITTLALAGVAIVFGVVSLALQNDQVAELFSQRANLQQSYDAGPEGRFGGQLKALDTLLDNPFGIGALEFPRQLHHEVVHNVYLSMFLNAGWLGGLLFLLVTVATIALGFRLALRPSGTQGYLLVALAGLVATLMLGFVVDTDHWRHLYALMGIIWALSTGDQPRQERGPRIVRDLGPMPVAHAIALPEPPSPRPPNGLGRRVAQVLELKPAAHQHTTSRAARILDARPKLRTASSLTVELKRLMPVGPPRRSARILGPIPVARAPRILAPIAPLRPARLLVAPHCLLPPAQGLGPRPSQV